QMKKADGRTTLSSSAGLEQSFNNDVPGVSRFGVRPGEPRSDEGKRQVPSRRETTSPKTNCIHYSVKKQQGNGENFGNRRLEIRSGGRVGQPVASWSYGPDAFRFIPLCRVS